MTSRSAHTELGSANGGGGPLAIEFIDVSKGFPGVQALDRVSLDVRYGEIHALVGENGAGKSTLIGCVSGLVRPDEGGVRVDGRHAIPRNPREARAVGVTVIPQEPLAVPGLSAGRNVLLGVERFRVRRARLTSSERARVKEALARCGAAFDPETMAAELSVPQVRLLQIARTLVATGDVIVLDEPTAVLSEADAEALLHRLAGLKQDGKAILYVSHRLGEVLRIADRVTVLRDGRRVGTFDVGDVDRARLISLMAKRSGPARSAPTKHAGAPAGEVILEVDSLVTREGFPAVSLSARAGEIVAIAGVQGSGHGGLLRTIAGLSTPYSGRVLLKGHEISLGSAPAAYRSGVVLVPADRRRGGLVATLSVRDNLALPVKVRAGRFGFRDRRNERRLSRDYVTRFDVRSAGLDVPAGTLSGGNQQKLALARAVEANPKVLLLEEPTQGIDVNAKVEIRALIREIADRADRAVIVASSEFEELLELADVIHVMREGRLVTSMPGRAASYEKILHEALS